MKTMWKSAAAALAIGLSAQAAMAAGPVTTLKAPTSVIEVKDGRNTAAAVGAVGGLAAGILLGGLMSNQAQAAPQEVYVQPQDYGYEPMPAPRPVYQPSYPQPNYAYRPPAPQPRYYGETQVRRGVEMCRRGILSAARRYGAYDARAGEAYRISQEPDSIKFRVPIRVFYPQGERYSVVACRTDRGGNYLIKAQAVR